MNGTGARRPPRADRESPFAAVGAPRPGTVHRLPAFQPGQFPAGDIAARDAGHSLVTAVLDAGRGVEKQ
jgi:hypothetical protein